MYHSINGISIDDYSYDVACLNCRYWIIWAAGGGMICDNGKGFTSPDDS